MTRDSGETELEDSKTEPELVRVSLDFVFKRIFGVEKHRRVLKHLLNAILRGNPRIESLELANVEIPRSNPRGKDVILDIKARTPSGTLVTIEMQCVNRGELMNRSIYYQACLMVPELERGGKYEEIPSIISIWITDYIATPRKDSVSEVVHAYRGTELSPWEVASDKCRTFIIELPKINRRHLDESDFFNLWMTFIEDPTKIPPELFTKIPELGEAMQELKYLSSDDNFRALCEARWLAFNSEQAAIAHAERRGEQRGEQRGRQEGKLEFALSLLGKGIDIGTVAECSGLSIDEINRLGGLS